MADSVISKQELIDAQKDAKSLEEVVNGGDAKQVTTRLGETYPSVKKAIKTLFENGGLPATPFATKALMTASALADGKYAMVTNDTVNNGLYVKTAGAWVKSAYDPKSQALAQSLNVFKTIPDMLAATPVVGMTALVTNSSISGENIYYTYTSDRGWIPSDYTPIKESKSYTDLKTIEVQRRENFKTVKKALVAAPKFEALTETERHLFDFVQDLEVNGDTNRGLNLVVNYSNNIINELYLSAGDGIRIDLLSDSVVSQTIWDNSVSKKVQFSSGLPNGEMVWGYITYDYSTKPYDSYAYQLLAQNPNLTIKPISKSSYPFDASFALQQSGEINLPPNSIGGIGKQSVFTEINITSQLVLGSVSVNIISTPNEQPSWVECCIYFQDDGFETAPRIVSSDQIPIYKTGVLKLPLENKMLKEGRYIIGFKTNVPECLASHRGSGKFWKIYDEAGLPMPLTAPPIRQPAIMDSNPAMVAFSLHPHKRIAQPIFPQDWHLEYRPQYKLLGVLDDNLYYVYSEEYHGRQKTTLSISTDGGKTITAISDEIPSSNELFEDIRQRATGRSAIVRNTDNSLDFYLPLSLGGIAKVTLNTDMSITATDITPPLLSKQGKDSYAPAIHWKGCIWYGEYGDPEAPKIHKYDLATKSWYVSIEKPNVGKLGARHLHYLYVSPSNNNIMWAVWGDVHGGGSQGLSRLEITASKASTQLDNWVQWSIGVHDKTLNTTLPYPTSVIEVFEPKNGLLGSDEAVLIGSGDQPPTHLVGINTKPENAGKALFYPLSFKRESAPMTETCHWLTMDDEKTIYYLTAEGYPVVSVYASPYPYTETFQLTQYWQAARAGCIEYNKGYINCTYFRFPKVKFRNILDNPEISKIPYLPAAQVGDDMVVHYNRLLDYLRHANMMQTFYEQGSDKSAAHPWVDYNFDSESRWSNWGQK